jgi:hypothetical protein
MANDNDDEKTLCFFASWSCVVRRVRSLLSSSWIVAAAGKIRSTSESIP